MADDVQTVRRINWREAFPFTHLFRAFRIAIHPSKLVLGLLALLGLYCGGRIFDELWRPRRLAGAQAGFFYEGNVPKGGGHWAFNERRGRARAALLREYAAPPV